MGAEGQEVVAAANVVAEVAVAVAVAVVVVVAVDVFAVVVDWASSARVGWLAGWLLA